MGPLVAALGALLLIVSLFLDWYDTLSGFTVFEFLDLLLLLLAVATIMALVAGMGLIALPITTGVGLGVALFAAFIVLTQIINDPPAVVGPGPDKDIGIWLALAGAALMVAGAVLAYAQISLAVEPRGRMTDRHEAETTSAPAARPAPAGYAAPGESRSPGTTGVEDEPGARRAPSDDPTRPLADPDAPPPRGPDRP